MATVKSYFKSADYGASCHVARVSDKKLFSLTGGKLENIIRRTLATIESDTDDKRNGHGYTTLTLTILPIIYLLSTKIPSPLSCLPVQPLSPACMSPRRRAFDFSTMPTVYCRMQGLARAATLTRVRDMNTTVPPISVYHDMHIDITSSVYSMADMRGLRAPRRAI